MEDGKQLFVTCDCGDYEHMIVYRWDDDLKCIYTNIQLRQWRNMFKRIWIAIKYVFGYESKQGHWDCTILNADAMAKLRDFIDAGLEDIAKDRMDKSAPTPTEPIVTYLPEGHI